MFKKLRDKLIIINITITLIILISSFVMIYNITRSNTSKELTEHLYKYMNNAPIFQNDITIGKENPTPNMTFIVIYKGETLNQVIGPNISGLSTEELDKLVAKIIKKEKQSGIIKSNKESWAYLIEPGWGETKIALTYATPMTNTLNSLITSAILIITAMTIVVFFTSQYLADKSVRPVEEAFNKQKRFITDASHELKTPLTIISANTDLLISKPNEKIKENTKWLNILKKETERMSKLTNDLLYLSKIESDKLIYSEENLSNIIEEIVMNFEAIIFEKKLKLITNIEKDITLKGSQNELKQLITIILDNAVKYSNESIIISLTKNTKNTIISVKNTCETISKEKLANIFDRFYRIDESRSRNTGGYGIGLSIAASIIEKHKGTIEINSSDNIVEVLIKF